MKTVLKTTLACAISIGAFQAAGDIATEASAPEAFNPYKSVDRQISAVSTLRLSSRANILDATDSAFPNAKPSTDMEQTVLASLEFNPNETIKLQMDSVSNLNNTSRSNRKNSEAIELEGPQLQGNVDKSLESELSEIKVASIELDNVTQNALEYIRGTYTTINLPHKLSKNYLANLPKPTGDTEFKCLAEAIYFEARGESIQGQRAVAEVILNRVNSKRYPNTICKVVNQGTGKKYRCQFSYTCDGIPDVVRNKSAYNRSAKIARLMIDGLYDKGQLTDGALFYHTTAVSPSWSYVKKRTAQLGVHLFYR